MVSKPSYVPAGSLQVSTAPGVLSKIQVNGGGTFSLYDTNSGSTSGTQIAAVGPVGVPGVYEFDCTLAEGLYVVASGASCSVFVIDA